MKWNKLKKFMMFIIVIFLSNNLAKAQTQEVQQLLLNVEKLSQLKNILRDMKNGYNILSGGYNAIRDISKGNFSLHEVFLDGLMLVSPEVKKYRRVVDIINYQKKIVSEYSTAFKQFKASDNFNLSEIEYLGNVYKKLVEQSVDNLDQLALIITSSKLRMSDQERLTAIDRIFSDTEEKLIFLRKFNTHALTLSNQRELEKADINRTLDLYP